MTYTISCFIIIMYLSFVLSHIGSLDHSSRAHVSLSLEIRVIRIAAPCGRLMALFLFLGNLKHGFPILLPIFIISTPKRAERRNFMSAIIHLMGRVTKDPVMQQGRNNATEYIYGELELHPFVYSQGFSSIPEGMASQLPFTA